MRADERWGRLAVGLAIAGLMVTGCSDADGNAQPTEGPTEVTGTTTPTAEPTAAGTPDPGPTAWPEPTRPPEMERDDVEGATAAVEYFLELFTYAHMTGDLNAWNLISDSDCVFCSDVAREVQGLYESGGYADGPLLEVTQVEAEPPGAEYEYFSVWIDALEEPSSRYDEDGTVVETFESSQLEIDVAVERTDDEWIVRGVVADDVEAGQSDG